MAKLTRSDVRACFPRSKLTDEPQVWFTQKDVEAAIQNAERMIQQKSILSSHENTMDILYDDLEVVRSRLYRDTELTPHEISDYTASIAGVMILLRTFLRDIRGESIDKSSSV